MRGTDAFVAVFQLNAESHAVAYAVAAPGAAHAGFRHAQRFGVRVAGFEARFNQLTPDFRQVIFLRAEQADTLGTGDFGVQVKLTGDTTHGDQPFRGDFLRQNAGSPSKSRLSEYWPGSYRWCPEAECVLV